MPKKDFSGGYLDMGKKKNSEHVEGLCLLCGQVPKKDKAIREDKDFVCSGCTQYLLEHPRKSGENIEDVLNIIRGTSGTEVST